MLKVFICEDNVGQREYMTQCVNDIIQAEKLDMVVECSSDDPDEILSVLKQVNQTGVFFLDIDLNKRINGIELAEEIRKLQPRCYIIFVTTHSEMSYMTITYKVEAMDFIIKDNIREINNRVHQCLVNCQYLDKQRSEETIKNYLVKFGDRVKAIPYDEILFFEVSNNSHKIILYAINCQIEFNGKMKELQKELDQRFVRCHRSYLINRDNIKEINEEESIVIMKNGITCPMSVRLGKGLRQGR